MTRLLILAVCVLAQAQAMDMKPLWLGDPFLEGWVPETDQPLRGIIIGNGSKTWPAFFEAATWWNFAILRINTDGYFNKGSNQDERLAGPFVAPTKALVHGIRRLGERTGHPELEWVPMVTHGFSRYSPSASRWMETFSNRGLAFFNGHGGGTSERDVFARVPSLGLRSGFENIYNRGKTLIHNVENAFWTRPAGHLAAAHICWRVYHDPNSYPDLAIPFLDAVIDARIPKDWDPRQGPCELQPMREEDGWLGAHDGWLVAAEELFQPGDQRTENARISAFADFEGDKSKASWLPNEELAWIWRSHSSRWPLARVVSPGTDNYRVYDGINPPTRRHLEAGVRVGERFRFAVMSQVHGMAEITFYSGTTKLGSTSAFSGGDAELGSSRQAEFAIEAVLDQPGVHVLHGHYRHQDGRSGWIRGFPIVAWP